MENARIKCQRFNLEEEKVVYHKGADMRSCARDSGSDVFPAHVVALIRGTEGNKGYLHRKLEWNEKVSLKKNSKKQSQGEEEEQGVDRVMGDKGVPAKE